METRIETLGNGNTITYKVVNGTCYHAETVNDIVNVLESARINRTRLRVYYGDINTGKDWHEEHDIVGYIGRSTGSNKIPLLVYNERSYGGVALLDNCIVKIKEAKGGKVLYQHPTYQQPEMEIVLDRTSDHPFTIHIDGELYSRHTTFEQAQQLRKKLS